MTGSSSTVGQRDEVAVAEEDVELAGVQALDDLVVDREVEDAEEVVRVLVDLRALALGEDVLEIEGVPAEAGLELLGLLRRRRCQMDPGELAVVELSEPRLGPRDGDLGHARAPGRPLDAGQARHRD